MTATTGREGIYRRLSTRMWGDAKFTRLSPTVASGQSLWIYLLVGPHTGPIPGVFVSGRAAMAEALGWTPEAFAEAFAEVFAEGLVEVDHRVRLWFIPKAIHHNMPANPNVIKSWKTAWSLLPECDLRERIADHIAEALLEGNEQATPWLSALEAVIGKPFGKPFEKPLGEGSPKPSPKQEAARRKQETARKPPTPLKGVDPEGFAEFWNAWPRSPRKQDRKKCAAKWKRGGFASLLPTILAHVNACKQSRQWREGFEPGPLTYLNGERWSDGMPDEASGSDERRPVLNADENF